MESSFCQKDHALVFGRSPRWIDLDIIVFKPGYLGYPPLGHTFEERKARMPDFTGDEFKDKNQYNIIKLGKPKTREERQFTYDHASGHLFLDQAFETTNSSF